jgi:hypothetical protein
MFTRISGYVLVRQEARDHITGSQGRPQFIYIFHSLEAANKAFDEFVTNSWKSKSWDVKETY